MATVIKSCAAAGTNYKSFVYDLYTLFTTDAGLSAAWPVIATSGDWSVEANVVSGDYFRVQCATAWTDDSTQQEFLFGWRSAAGAVGGYAMGAAGVCIVGAPKGGWNAGALTYNAPQTGILEWNINLNPCTYHLWYDAETLLLISDSDQNGDWTATGNYTFYLGKLDAVDSLDKPWAAMVTNTPSVHTSSGYSDYTATMMKALAVDESGCYYCYVTPTSWMDVATQLTGKDFKKIGWPEFCVVERQVANKVVGLWRNWAARMNRTSATAAPEVINGGVNWHLNGIVLPW